MRNVLEVASAPAPTLTVEAVRNGEVAVFTDASFFGGFADGGQEALHATLSLAKAQVEEALMTTQVETLSPGISDWKMTVDVEDDGNVKIRRLFLADVSMKLQNWEGVILMVASALAVLLAKTVIFV